MCVELYTLCTNRIAAAVAAVGAAAAAAVAMTSGVNTVIVAVC